MDQGRERLRDLSTRLMQLHRLLLDRERQVYEARHGSIPSRDVLRLVIHDEHFAWLRTLSTLIAHIDEAADANEPTAERDVDSLFRQTYRLLKSDAGGDFQSRYHEALQESPEIVMAHAEVSKVLPPSRPPER